MIGTRILLVLRALGYLNLFLANNSVMTQTAHEAETNPTIIIS